MIKSTDTFLSALSPRIAFGAALTIVFILGGIDYFTPVFISFDSLYLLPVGFCAWYCSRGPAVVMAICAVVSWTMGSTVPQDFLKHPIGAGWNIVSELMVFTLFSLLLGTLRNHLDKMDDLASLDQLTGVANRRSFYKAVERESRRCQRYGMPFTIAYIDIDDFKKVNDTHGHTAGDRLLMCVAQTLRALTRATDTLGRIGGDEFIVLLPETDSTQAHQTIDKLVRELPLAAAATQLPVTFSIGVVTYLKAPLSIEETLSSVDDVMDHVKRATENSVQFATWPPQKC